ncbi:MAG: phenylacetate--CoA ligase family protein [Candidatus Rokubacteria bacterium]|nr:phenylacetate--CoA ligase family protein [Candidatus Rokubacteria bacterium]
MGDPRFFADVEGAAWTDVLRLKQEKLLAQLAYVAARSEFYRRKFAAAGVDVTKVKRLADVETLPFTEKTELRASLAEAPPLGHHRAAPMDRVVQIQASSGTTGSPAYVGLTRHDQYVWQETGARCLYAHGIRPGDLTMHGFSVSRGFVGGLPISQIVLHLGAVEIPIGADAGTDRILRVTKDTRPRALLATPFFALHLGEQAPRLVGEAAEALGVRIVSVGGEPGGGIPVVRQKIESLWSADCRELCGGTDLGVAYWAECERKTGMHETAQEFIYIELIDPDTGAVRPWTEGTTGELVYTALDRECSPLVRFRTRDHAVVTGTGPCACGRTAPTIRVFGRTDDMLIVKGINVFPSAIRDVVTGFEPRTTGNLRVVADFPGHTTQRPLRIKVEHGPALAGRGDDVDRLRQEIAERLRGLLNFAPAVEMVPPDTFEKPGVHKVALIVREPEDRA